MKRILARLFPRQRPGYGWPTEAAGLHGSREADARREWLHQECEKHPTDAVKAARDLETVRQRAELHEVAQRQLAEQAVRLARLERELSSRQALALSSAEQRQRMAAQRPEPRRLTDAQQEAIRALNGRTLRIGRQ